MSIVNPVYPPQDVKEPIRGVVVMRVLVSETGVPIEVVVVERAPGSLTEAAVAAVRQWRFEPAIQNGRAFRAWTIVGIPFEAIPFPQPSPTETPSARRSTPGTGSGSLP
jgi:protein TonB